MQHKLNAQSTQSCTSQNTLKKNMIFSYQSSAKQHQIIYKQSSPQQIQTHQTDVTGYLKLVKKTLDSILFLASLVTDSGAHRSLYNKIRPKRKQILELHHLLRSA